MTTVKWTDLIVWFVVFTIIGMAVGLMLGIRLSETDSIPQGMLYPCGSNCSLDIIDETAGIVRFQSYDAGKKFDVTFTAPPNTLELIREHTITPHIGVVLDETDTLIQIHRATWADIYHIKVIWHNPAIQEGGS